LNPYSACATGIPYEITVWTGNVRGAGTDSNVFIQMYGEGGKTEEYVLRNRTNNFEQGEVDKFKVTVICNQESVSNRFRDIEP